ncbi:hypothetical protein [Streptomyces mirabilis]|uniref:hypothetical protein n=1 Tax=Streptomyces mirabilis TaxID=68239 RepID=UPI0033A2DE13
MREMRRRGTAAACVAAVVVVLGGCSSGGEGGEVRAKSPQSAESSPPVEVAPNAETEDPYPDTPAGNIDRKADTEGWTYDSDLYVGASAFVEDICESLPDSAVDGSSRPQWLVESGNLADDGQKILEFGIPKMCPKWTKTLKQAVSGNYERWISSGEFEVKAHPKPYDPNGDSDVHEIGPGTYQAKGEFSDCYWERTSQSGNIIENKFVTQARVLTVTLRVGELFKNECGTFKPVH